MDREELAQRILFLTGKTPREYLESKGYTFGTTTITGEKGVEDDGKTNEF